ncbi:cupin domain-containing protein [Mycolicibacterium vaccae]|uniref:cupin domain-containing protein n=1 Tax=Mycolicibacterium vaccae TaxID=1810 RepID=UPI003D08262A
MPKLIHVSETETREGLTPTGRRPGADEGDPQVRTLSLESGTGVRMGVWECTPGSWVVRDRPDTETFYVIEGKARLHDDESGTIVAVEAGDFVTFPAGWSGRWTVVETVRKAYTVA